MSTHLAIIYYSVISSSMFFFFFFNDPATTEIYTLSLHDALPIWGRSWGSGSGLHREAGDGRWHDQDSSCRRRHRHATDRKSTRLNSSHQIISYAVFCLKKKKKKKKTDHNV